MEYCKSSEIIIPSFTRVVQALCSRLPHYILNLLQIYLWSYQVN